MGESATGQGDFSAGVTYYQRAADQYPETDTAPIALYAIAFGNIERQQYAEAVVAFEQLSTRYPNSPYVEAMGLALAEAYYEVGEYELVVEEINRRINRLPDEASERAGFLLAEAYNQLRDSENAIVAYRRFTEENPDSPFYRVAL